MSHREPSTPNKHLPNALTVLRIAAVPALAWLATCGTAMFFVAVLIAWNPQPMLARIGIAGPPRLSRRLGP